MAFSDSDQRYMRQALQLAQRGLGHVEPNPLVGCVVVRAEQVVGEGWHERFGESHAEVNALRAAGDAAAGATLYVTLEPCCHQGKTPPCTAAILAAKVARVVVAATDCFPKVAGRGIQELRAAGVQVDVGLLADEAQRLTAPFAKLVLHQRPWIIAKWAMTLDGKLATVTGDSQWISAPESRQIVHELRGRMDAVLVGSETALRDDPLLTARPPGVRRAVRIVVDSRARLPVTSQLAQTAREVPVLVAVGAAADPLQCDALRAQGCELFVTAGSDAITRLAALLDELGRRRLTNVFVEGGAGQKGNLFDLGEIDEVHAFIAAKLIGGRDAITPIGGHGLPTLTDAVRLDQPQIRPVGGDVYVSGRVQRPSATVGQPSDVTTS